MEKGKESLVCDPLFISKIVSCVQDAVEDDIKQDLRGLVTTNSAPTRVWDFLNTHLYNRMPAVSCIANVTKRGSWEMVPVYEEKTGILFTCMRESRYEELHKNVHKRAKPNYLDCLIDVLNPDLVAPVEQLSFFPFQFPDKESMRKVVQKILIDLQVEESVVKRHALVLFQSKGFELSSIRAVMIDKNMNIVCEEGWHTYISTNVSVVMDSSDEFSAPANNPGRGLKLSAKANERKKRNFGVKKPEIEKQSGDER